MGARVVISLEGEILSEIQLEKPVTVVGRHPDCDVVIDHPAISGRHMLFRVANRTVYAEDLASTNGTRVNGLSTGHRVVHHLDMIEIGRHKLHFFDDALLAGHVENLESTVFNQYEQTMLAAHVPAARASVRPAGDDLDRTMAITRPPATHFGLAQGSVATAAPQADLHEGVNGAARLALRVVAGTDEGHVVLLDRPNTMIGRVGRDTALVIRRGHSFFIARLAGHRPLRLNRVELGPGTHPIAERDLIDVGASTFEVIVAT